MALIQQPVQNFLEMRPRAKTKLFERVSVDRRRRMAITLEESRQSPFQPRDSKGLAAHKALGQHQSTRFIRQPREQAIDLGGPQQRIAREGLRNTAGLLTRPFQHSRFRGGQLQSLDRAGDHRSRGMREQRHDP